MRIYRNASVIIGVLILTYLAFLLISSLGSNQDQGDPRFQPLRMDFDRVKNSSAFTDEALSCSPEGGKNGTDAIFFKFTLKNSQTTPSSLDLKWILYATDKASPDGYLDGGDYSMFYNNKVFGSALEKDLSDLNPQESREISLMFEIPKNWAFITLNGEDPTGFVRANYAFGLKCGKSNP